jgi:hypothetical protein
MNATTPSRARYSIEPGHFYSAAFAEGMDAMVARFRQVGYFVNALAEPGDSISFLFDDYHNRPQADVTPSDIIWQIQESSTRGGVRIDYIAREAACVRLAKHVLELLKPTGYVRETEETRWLLDDPRPNAVAPPAMSPLNAVAHERSSYIDVEIYNNSGQGRPWACPYLAAIWQGLRLGELHDSAFDQPYLVGDDLPDWSSWEETPALIQLNPNAQAFVAERSLSVLPASFLEVEGAVQKILGRFSLASGLTPPVQERVSHAFLSGI